MFQHKYKKHKKNPKSPMSMKSQMTYLPSLDKLDSPKSVYLSEDQASCSSQTTTMSAPPSPHTDSYPQPPIGVNILKAVLTGSQEVRIVSKRVILKNLLISIAIEEIKSLPRCCPSIDRDRTGIV